MSAERRYSEQEIAAIFEKAAEEQKTAQQTLHGEGLTLAELQQIGAEAGLLPEFVARAAAASEHKVTALPRRTYLGLPVGVARTVEWPGAFTDADWDRLVADLRGTFHAKGKVSREGGLRTWRNGNLQAIVEPTDTGHRLRLQTTKGDAQGVLGFGLVFFLMGLVGVLSPWLGLGGMGSLAETGGILMLMGLAVSGVSAFQLPRWAEERSRQMDAVAARVLEHRVKTAAPVAAPPSPRLDLDALMGQEADASAAPPHGRRRSRS